MIHMCDCITLADMILKGYRKRRHFTNHEILWNCKYREDTRYVHGSVQPKWVITLLVKRYYTPKVYNWVNRPTLLRKYLYVFTFKQSSYNYLRKNITHTELYSP